MKEKREEENEREGEGRVVARDEGSRHLWRRR